MSKLSNLARVSSLLISLAYLALAVAFFSQDRAGYGVAYLAVGGIWLGTAWIWNKNYQEDKRAERDLREWVVDFKAKHDIPR